ncbi:MAG: 5-formyltetrahydrofolate cyclo-ligase [uncultured bacterium]|nr:MAG: 5-formyltetrahydrofolate cyclo-ligase [uncultured bacterium]
MNISSKASFRQLLLEKRRTISALERQKAAESAAELLVETDFFRQSQHIACYYPTDDEFDCLPIIQKIWQAKKKCYLPSLTSQKILNFIPYQPNDALQLNRYRILEPVEGEPISLDKLDIVLVPLVGFDLRGHRLGMGAGYYDRTFHFLRGRVAGKCYFLGLAFLSQGVSILPEDAWDVSLQGVLTEKKIIYF